jgi:hypothetical protein
MLTRRQDNEEETMAVASMSSLASRGADTGISTRRLAWTPLLLDQSPPPLPLTQQSPLQPEVDPLPPHHRGHFRYSLWGMEHSSGGRDILSVSGTLG